MVNAQQSLIESTEREALVQEAVAKLNEELRITGKLDTKSLLAAYPEELHEELLGLANTALLAKRAFMTIKGL